MKRLLLLSCGTNACFHIAKVLKEKFSPDFFIVGCDINKGWLVPGGKFLDAFYQCPVSKDEFFYSFVLDVCEKEKIDFILPSFDADQFMFSSDNQRLSKLGIKSFAINSGLCFYKNKTKTSVFLRSIGIPVPEFFTKTTVEDEKEYFVKPVHGSGSDGVCKRKGYEIKRLDEISGASFAIQELCSDPEYTLECFLYDDKIYSIVRERIASKSGVCTKTRVFQDKKLERYACILAGHVNLPYIFNMQFMKNQKDEYVCTDLNLRPAGGMSLSYAAGWDEVSALAKIMLGKSKNEVILTVNKEISEQYIVRHYEDTVTKKIKKKIAFDFDGTLLDSRKRHEIVMSDVLKIHNIELDSSDLVAFKSDGHNNIEWLLSKGVLEKLCGRINDEWMSLIEDDEYLKNDILYPNVIEALGNLSKENDLFLITARKNKESASNQIKRLGIAQYFSGVSVVDSCADAPALKAVELQKYKVDCFIGDTESDYKAALAAGCDFKAVDYGFRSKSFWEKQGMQYCIDMISLFVQ